MPHPFPALFNMLIGDVPDFVQHQAITKHYQCSCETIMPHLSLSFITYTWSRRGGTIPYCISAIQTLCYKKVDRSATLLVTFVTGGFCSQHLCCMWSEGHFKITYELLNLRALKFSLVNKIRIFQCMGRIFCVEFQRWPLKFHTKYLTHTLKVMIFIHWNFKSS